MHTELSLRYQTSFRYFPIDPIRCEITFSFPQVFNPNSNPGKQITRILLNLIPLVFSMYKRNSLLRVAFRFFLKYRFYFHVQKHPIETLIPLLLGV